MQTWWLTDYTETDTEVFSEVPISPTTKEPIRDLPKKSPSCLQLHGQESRGGEGGGGGGGGGGGRGEQRGGGGRGGGGGEGGGGGGGGGLHSTSVPHLPKYSRTSDGYRGPTQPQTAQWPKTQATTWNRKSIAELARTASSSKLSGQSSYSTVFTFHPHTTSPAPPHFTISPAPPHFTTSPAPPHFTTSPAPPHFTTSPPPVITNGSGRGGRGGGRGGNLQSRGSKVPVVKHGRVSRDSINSHDLQQLHLPGSPLVED